MATSDAVSAPPRTSGISVSPWWRFAVKRGGGLILTVIVLVVATFVIVRLIPGDPAVQAAGPDADVARVAEVRAQLGLDRPVWRQFTDYLGALVHGDFGQSYALHQPVSELIAARLPFTLTVTVGAMVLMLLVAVPAGMVVGILTRGGRRRWLDGAFGVLTGGVSAVPSYVTATLLILIFPVALAVLYPAYTQLHQYPSLVLPILALAIGPICILSRVVRREIAVVLEQDYMRTARGWRLGTMRLYGKYAFPPLLTSTLTLSALILSSMLGGAIVVETVFSIPGLGLGLIRAILDKDYPTIQGIVLVLGVLAALLTLLVDVLLGIADPRTLGGSDD